MSTLARPRWRVGQVLQPRHLRALEGALSAEAARRAAVDGLPSHGVIALAWRWEGRPGVVFFDRLVAVFPGGALVDLSDNAGVRAPLDLKLVGRREIDVYLHLVEPHEHDETDEEPLAPPPGQEIERSRHRLALSDRSTLDDSRDRMLIGRFALDLNGGYALVEEAVPPLLRVDASPLLVRRLAQVRGELDEIEHKLDALAADALGMGLSLAPTHGVRIASRQLGALLADLTQGVHLHPYLVFAAIRTFALALSALDATRPPRTPAVYDHQHPWASFSAALDDVAWWAAWSPPGSPRVEFRLDGACRMVAALPDAALAATEVYVVVLKRAAADRVPFEQARVASPNRLRVVREYALQGVPVARDPSPPFRYGFGAVADFYRLTCAGDEWDHARRDRALAFQSSRELEGPRFVLCWRGP